MLASVKWLRPIVQRLEEAYSRYHSYQIDAIKGIETVKALGGETSFRTLMLEQFQGVARRLFRADFTAMCYEGAIDAVTFLGLGLFLWAGAHQVHGRAADHRRPGRVQLARGARHGPIRSAAGAVGQPAAGDRAARSPERRVRARAGAGRRPLALQPVRTLEGHIAFRGLGFRYGGPEAPPILQDITRRRPGRQDRRDRRPQRVGQDDARQVPGGAARADRRAPSSSTGRTSSRSTTATCAGRSASCCRTTTCSPTPSRATSRSARTSRTWTA